MSVPPPRNILVYLCHPVVACWSFSTRNRDRLQQHLPQINLTICPDQETFLRHLPSAEMVVVWSFEQEWFSRAPHLRWLATPAAGRDYFCIDPPARIRLTYGSFHGELMAETVVGMMLAQTRGILGAAGWQPHGDWPRPLLSATMRPLRDSHAMVLGFGAIGEWIGRLLKPFGVRVTGVRRLVTEARPGWMGPEDDIVPVAGMDEWLPVVDHLVLCLPSTPETDKIIDARRLGLLPAHAVLYNVGRGSAIDQEALVAALMSSHLAGACLDVYQHEPLPADSPLRGCPNTLLMPHVAAVSPNYLDLFVDELATTYRRIHGG